MILADGVIGQRRDRTGFRAADNGISLSFRMAATAGKGQNGHGQDQEDGYCSFHIQSHSLRMSASPQYR